MDINEILKDHTINLEAVMEDATAQAAEERQVRGVAGVKKAFGRISRSVVITVEKLQEARRQADEIKAVLNQLTAGLTTAEALDDLGDNGDAVCAALVRQIKSDLEEAGVTLPSVNDAPEG